MLDKIYDNLDECINDGLKFSSLYANEGVKQNIGGPFGSCIIQKINGKFKIIVIARNTVVIDKDATCHAEVNAIRKASRILDRFDLSDCILVTTAKSCPMCISAAIWSKIEVVYYGVGYELATKSGFDDSKILEYLQGKNKDIVHEIHTPNEYAKIPFETWLDKQDKTQY